MPGQFYKLKVNAYNADGESGFSNEISFTTLASSPPPAPTNLDYDSLSTTYCYLYWNDNSEETEFQIFRSVTDTLNFQIIGTSPTNQAYYLDQNINAVTTYYYRVKASDEDGSSPFSNTLKVITVIPVKNPENLTVLSNSGSTVVLSWTDSSDDEAGFQLERAESGSQFEKIATLGQNITEYTDVNLKPGTTYFYRIRSYSFIAHSKFSNQVSVTTENFLLPAPSNLTATEISNTWATLTWNDNSSNEDGFHIFRADDAFQFEQVATVNANQLTFTDVTLVPETNYYFYLSAFNNSGNSDNSDTIVVRTLLNDQSKPKPPLVQVYKRNSMNSVELNWVNQSENASSYMIYRALYPNRNFEIIHQVDASESTFTDLSVDPNSTYHYLVLPKTISASQIQAI
ncbi:MAG: fibronectin type III domain-containing protein [Bacteroidales bacterium]|nr:fibronectin type III domain-containing protein [Bacteroidales bacterium]